MLVSRICSLRDGISGLVFEEVVGIVDGLKVRGGFFFANSQGVVVFIRMVY